MHMQIINMKHANAKHPHSKYANPVPHKELRTEFIDSLIIPWKLKSSEEWDLTALNSIEKHLTCYVTELSNNLSDTWDRVWKSDSFENKTHTGQPPLTPEIVGFCKRSWNIPVPPGITKEKARQEKGDAYSWGRQSTYPLRLKRLVAGSQPYMWRGFPDQISSVWCSPNWSLGSRLSSVSINKNNTISQFDTGRIQSAWNVSFSLVIEIALANLADKYSRHDS